MNDILTTGSDYLAHYGVLGMKWGVRKRYSSAISQSTPISAPVKKKMDPRLKKALIATGVGVTLLGAHFIMQKLIVDGKADKLIDLVSGINKVKANTDPYKGRLAIESGAKAIRNIMGDIEMRKSATLGFGDLSRNIDTLKSTLNIHDTGQLITTLRQYSQSGSLWDGTKWIQSVL